MRTTVVLDDDVAAALDRIRRERSAGLSEVINDLIRAGLKARPPRRPFRQRAERIGIHVDVIDVAEALEQLDGPAAR
ncbi:MAG TPA: ribbon-helix-helix protein, CopG family [Candidatus Dormibacteraeota bacterium]|nr:ribbon-helix-helix protein, CopG family [Candidatus Dormibacteraeota bacterium]